MVPDNQSCSLFSGATGLPFYDDSSSIPPPPPAEISPTKVSCPEGYRTEPVDIDGLILLKGRVSTKEVMGLPSTDLVPGVYEGGLKLWEGSIDLVRALNSDVKGKKLSFTGKRVLELGCGHGLPGIFASLEGATSVHFQDFNAEVLQHLTIPNAKANHSKEHEVGLDPELRFFSGCWSQVHDLLPKDEEQDSGYDVILTAETIYSVSSQRHLYDLIKKCLKRITGVVYVAAKRYYFGVGGGTQQFLSLIEEDGFLVGTLVAEVSDGFSNVREVWKLSFK